MLHRINENCGKFKINQEWIPNSRISPHLIRAVRVAEGRIFNDRAGMKFKNQSKKLMWMVALLRVHVY